jgi:hypothetical protein
MCECNEGFRTMAPMQICMGKTRRSYHSQHVLIRLFRHKRMRRNTRTVQRRSLPQHGRIVQVRVPPRTRTRLRQTILQGHRRMLQDQWHLFERRLREHDGDLPVRVQRRVPTDRTEVAL